MFKKTSTELVEGACVLLCRKAVSNPGSGWGLWNACAVLLPGAGPDWPGLWGVVSKALARRRLEGGPIPLCSDSPFCEAAAVAAAAAAGASDWVSGSGTGANQRGQRTGGARHGVPTWQLPGICRVKLQDTTWPGHGAVYSKQQ